MREPAHNARCDRCGGPLIIAFGEGVTLTLDAAEQPDGAYRAWNRGDCWIAQEHDRWKHFAGMRRRAHVCVVPDRQLQLGA